MSVEGLITFIPVRSPPIVHSYLSSGVVLLTDNLVAKIGGFTFSVEVVSDATRSLESTAYSSESGDTMLRSLLNYGPPSDIYSFGCLICETITKQRIYGFKRFLIDDSIGKPLSYREYLINRIKDTSLKQLVMDCVNEDPGLRPSASLISGVIANLIKGE